MDKRIYTISALVFTCLCASAAQTIEADVAVIGGGSAGFGAAWSAAHVGAKVVLIEKEGSLGGNSTLGGVNNWEPGIGGTGVCYRIYREMRKIPNAIGIYEHSRHCSWPKPWEKYRFPGGFQAINPCLIYAHSLRRYGPATEAFTRKYRHGVVFEPEVMSQVMLRMLKETGKCKVLLNNAFVKAVHSDGVVSEVILADGTRVKAKVFIDATDGVLCQQLGCELMMGREPKSAFNEPGAPKEHDKRLNGATLLYRIAPIGHKEKDLVEPLPEGVPAKCWWRGGFPVAFMCCYPNGDRNVNMLPAMKGEEVIALGYQRAYAECKRRVYAHWHNLQKNYDEFRRFKLKLIFPCLGIRETQRIKGEYVLKQQDLIQGMYKQKHTDMIAIADHPMDSHGGGGPGGEMKQPYGIPYRCLLPLKTKNVMIAGRAASFSNIAASSCRLSRTMMQLGEAAGVASAISVADGSELRKVDAAVIRQTMQQMIDLCPAPVFND
ncbi:MAG: FAD-dependent oxidoreductase [Kiritimatiellae bacterium]|jgi:hypothetical protein|nr:FAD-dependent oxidoreductase [Kiritimatiellia bacterium]